MTGPFLVSFSFKLCPSVPVLVALQLHLDTMPTYILLCPASSDDQGVVTNSHLHIIVISNKC